MRKIKTVLRSSGFLTGVGSVICLAPGKPPRDVFISSEDAWQADARALAKDWDAIGRDFNIGRVMLERDLAVEPK